VIFNGEMCKREECTDLGRKHVLFFLVLVADWVLVLKNEMNLGEERGIT
jgi:hypothetical protein